MLWRTNKNPAPFSDETRRKYAEILARHAHKFPNGFPHWYSALILACARKCTLYPFNSDDGARLRRQRAAKATHAAIRAKGIVLCSQATEARLRKAQERKAREAGLTQAELRGGSANTDGI